MNEKFSLWLRVGMNIYATQDEMKRLLENEDSNTLKSILARGDFEFAYDSYVPEGDLELALDIYPFIDRNKVKNEPTFELP